VHDLHAREHAAGPRRPVPPTRPDPEDHGTVTRPNPLRPPTITSTVQPLARAPATLLVGDRPAAGPEVDRWDPLGSVDSARPRSRGPARVRDGVGSAD